MTDIREVMWSCPEKPETAQNKKIKFWGQSNFSSENILARKLKVVCLLLCMKKAETFFCGTMHVHLLPPVCKAVNDKIHVSNGVFFL